MKLDELKEKKVSDLREIAKTMGIEKITSFSKDELIEEIMKNNPTDFPTDKNLANILAEQISILEIFMFWICWARTLVGILPYTPPRCSEDALQKTYKSIAYQSNLQKSICFSTGSYS